MGGQPSTATLNPLRIRKILGREIWSVPTQFGPDGWRFLSANGSVLATVADIGPEGEEIVHASMAFLDRTPTYEELKLLHKAVFGGGWAYQVFAPPVDHVNINSHALHIWGRLDGKPMLPNFGMYGSI